MIHTTIGGCRVVGTLCVGNKNGLLVPNSTTDKELQHLRNSLPDSVKIGEFFRVLLSLTCKILRIFCLNHATSCCLTLFV